MHHALLLVVLYSEIAKEQILVLKARARDPRDRFPAARFSNDHKTYPFLA